MSNDDPDVPITCPECDTTSRIPLSRVAEAVERHNETRHDGEDVAGVDPDVVANIADMVAEDMGLTGDVEDEYEDRDR
jgi:hypothetical protein